MRTARAYRRAVGRPAITLEAVTSTRTPTGTGVRLLDPPSWQALQAAHESRVGPWVRPHLERRRAGVPHPVEDFLFTYYSFRPAALLRWHPGYGTALVGSEEHASLKGYGELGGGVGVTTEHVLAQRAVLTSVHALLSATAGRPGQFGCFGMHEWAMVYRLEPEEVRHAAWPLRLGPAGTDEVVESHRITCTHFDAYRFFTEAARPLNTARPGRDDRPAFEQPACLHAGMDLYKHAFRLVPMVPSELVADCFELARDIRVLDMRASPYDLTGLGHEPVRVETPEGKQEYVTAQRAFAERAAPLRAQLIEATERLLAL
jgi:hypothetical protein